MARAPRARGRRWPLLLCVALLLLAGRLKILPCAVPPAPGGTPSRATRLPEGTAVTSIRRYFDAWNRRDMKSACDQFSDNCTYEDTQYAGDFQGKAALEAH